MSHRAIAETNLIRKTLALTLNLNLNDGKRCKHENRKESEFHSLSQLMLKKCPQEPPRFAGNSSTMKLSKILR